MLVDGLRDLYDLTVPGGAFYLFPRLPWGSGMEFVARGIEQYQLLVIPGSVFSRRDTHFRISYAASDETIARGIEALAKTLLPNDLDLVDHLGHAVQPGNGGLGQLLQIETWDLAAKIEPLAVVFAPDSLHREVRLVQDPVFRQGKDLLGLRFVLEGFQDNTPLEGLAVKTLGSTTRLIVTQQEALLARGAYDFPGMVSQ